MDNHDVFRCTEPPPKKKKTLKDFVKIFLVIYSIGEVWGRYYALPVSQIPPLSKKMASGGCGNGEIESLDEELEHILLF